MARIRILLTDDHTLFRQGIRTLLSAESDIDVVGEAANGSESVEQIQSLRPDVVLMDIGMPGLSSFEATRQIKKARPGDEDPVPDDVRRRGLLGRVHGSRGQRLRSQGQPGAATASGYSRRLPAAAAI